MSSSTIAFLLAVPAIIILPERHTPTAICAFVIAVIALTWEGYVSENVPDPYLDEVFHIPQAQAYCAGRFDVWDPKLTTPPGLYVVSTGILSLFSCTVEALRIVNALTVTALVAPLMACRSLIFAQRPRVVEDENEEGNQNWNAAHTALNICLFPPLFFFSGLYYTDVLSTLVVVLAYGLFLQNGRGLGYGIGQYLIGVAALGMRQTNIFWVAVFMGGLEWVRACEELRMQYEKSDGGSPHDAAGLEGTLRAWQKDGLLRNKELQEARPDDLILYVLSLALSALLNPVLIFRRLWPYLGLVVSFTAFVFWNGGVVLGDKSNHVATIHLPQMLYIWPFITFFSLPILYPFVIEILHYVFHSLSSRASRKPGFGVVAAVVTALVACAVFGVIVHFNTIIHPFTLADNRHYMFYVFRYTILRHPLIKYALVPIYVIEAWLVLRSLGDIPTPYSSPIQPPANRTASTQSSLPKTRVSEGQNISSVLIWLLTTGLSLITAPLVEPRYFIIPWVIWRLHVTTSRSTSLPKITVRAPSEFPILVTAENGHGDLQTPLAVSAATHSNQENEGGFGEAYDYELYLETMWFLAINLITGYVFLYRGFKWEQEPGNIQRFMW